MKVTSHAIGLNVLACVPRRACSIPAADLLQLIVVPLGLLYNVLEPMNTASLDLRLAAIVRPTDKIILNLTIGESVGLRRRAQFNHFRVKLRVAASIILMMKTSGGC